MPTPVTDLATRPAGALAMAKSEDIKHGGTTSNDLEIPRATILQGLSPDVLEGGLSAGKIINSLTKEYLDPTFLALFPFKQYIEFGAKGGADEGKVIRKTIDRTEAWVEEGLVWKEDKAPAVTEFLNILTLFKTGGEWDTSMPLILSFKKTSLRIGRQFNTLLALSQTAGKPYYSVPYSIKTVLKQDGNKSWFIPKVSPIPSKEAKLDKDVLTAAAMYCAQFKPLIKEMPVEVVGEEQDPVEA